jgi:hypothetical protein
VAADREPCTYIAPFGKRLHLVRRECAVPAVAEAGALPRTGESTSAPASPGGLLGMGELVDLAVMSDAAVGGPLPGGDA